MQNRVVITGIGCISPIGNDAKTTWENMINGVSGIDYIKRFDASRLNCFVDAEVKDFNPKKYYEKMPDIRKADLNMQYAMGAAIEAIDDSKINESNIDKDRIGVYIGSGIGGIDTTIRECNKLFANGPEKISPFFVPMMISNMATGSVAIRYGFRGPTLPVVTACATSGNTVGEAYRAIKHGYADCIIAGGTESAINELSMAGFVNCQALTPCKDKDMASIPFDKRRSGFVMGEGSAILVLEKYESAIKRNAHIYAEIVAYGNNCDAYHITSPEPTGAGAKKCIEMAAREALLDKSASIYVNAHGTSTHLNDLMETKAYKDVFGENAKRLHISSTKSMTGHMLGATGAIEIIAAAKALEDGICPPTIGYMEKDEECDLNYTPNKAVNVDLDYAISTSFGFGGHNACVILKKVEEV